MESSHLAALLLYSTAEDGIPPHKSDTGNRMTNSATGPSTALVIMIGHDEWRVYELPAPAYDRRGANNLIFETDGVMRRVRTYPEDWRDLTAEALLALSWQS